MRVLEHALVAVLALFFLGTTGEVRAQASTGAAADGGALSLEQAVARVLQFNPDLTVVRREVEAADGARLQASLRPNPTVSYDMEDSRQRFRSSTVMLTQPIELGGKRSARIELADRRRDLAESDVRLKRADVRGIAIQFFFDALSAQEQRELVQGSLLLAGKAVDAAAKRVQAGRVSPVEETRARVAETTTRSDLARAEAELAAARSRLAALWGGKAADFQVLAGDLAKLPEAPPEAVLSDRLERSPELARAQSEIGVRKAAVGLARAQAYPEFGVTLGSRAIVETGQHAPSVGFSVSIPIFDRNQGNIQEAQVRAIQARESLVASQIRLQTDVDQAVQRLNGARRQAELIRGDALPGAQSALDAALRGFELGKFTFLDVLDAQRTLFGVRAQLIAATSEAFRSSADLERLLGPATPEAPAFGR